MKYLVSIFTIAFFLTTVVFAQTQDKQQVKKDVKVEKVKKEENCSTGKTSDKTKKETCDTEKSKVKSDESCCSENESKAQTEDDDCCKTEKSSTKTKESKN